MGSKRYGVEGDKGTGGQRLPFALAVEADGWLYVSGQELMVDGELVGGTILAKSHQAIQYPLSVLKEPGYSPGHAVRCGVWIDDPRDFQAFNRIFCGYFAANPPARPASSPAWSSIAKRRSIA